AVDVGAAVVRAPVTQRVAHAPHRRLVGGETFVEGEDARYAAHAGYRTRGPPRVRATTTNGGRRTTDDVLRRSGDGMDVHLQELQTVPGEGLEDRVGVRTAEEPARARVRIGPVLRGVLREERDGVAGLIAH